MNMKSIVSYELNLYYKECILINWDNAISYEVFETLMSKSIVLCSVITGVDEMNSPRSHRIECKILY